MTTPKNERAESPQRLGDLHRQLVEGAIDRRQFMVRAGALGLGASAIGFILQNSAVAQDATPGATPAGAEAFVRPTSGTDGQTRGEGGDLRILVPQGASALSVHNATGGKDIAAGSIISEPLLAYAAGHFPGC